MPRVINNSWGGNVPSKWFKDAIDTWLKAGIVPVFGGGNDGPQCSTVASPGNLSTVIAVGATTMLDGLYLFGSRGPSAEGVVKPDISAPGVNILSSASLSDTSYEYRSGTEAATPHVSGVVALLLSAKPNLTYNQVKDALFRSAERKLQVPIRQCGSISPKVFPNNNYGHGRVNALHCIEHCTVC